MHINTRYIKEDINVLLPLARMTELENEGLIGRLAATAYSFYGFQWESTEFLQEAIEPISRKMKQEEVEASVSNLRINLKDHEATLNSWLEYDKPEGFKRNWLVKLNNMISEQAEERLVRSGLEDAEE